MNPLRQPLRHPFRYRGLTPARMCAAALLALTPATAAAHPATERYIPIGESPGLSGSGTYIGRIRAVDDDTHTLTVEPEDGGARQTILITPASDMWLDRTGRGRASKDASFEDCRRGRRIEVKLHDDSREADWVKIEAR